MEEQARRALTAGLVEAIETGNPLARMPPGTGPRSLADGEEVAAAVLESLGIVPCGLRLRRRDGAPALVGPMVDGRLLPDGAPVVLRTLRHPVVTAAAIGVLAAPLAAEESGPPAFARIHPALDIAATRFTEAPEEDAALAADLAGLGLVVAGKGRVVAPGPLKVALGRKGTRPPGVEVDLAAAFAEAAAVAREWGGLPAGGLLVVAGLSAAVTPEAGVFRARLGALGAAEAAFA
ncbi:hypothetical protein [Roseomonas sp. AR75]|uniref:hypothetical protein n=1 Tax=Roseomonas sp. AR75 TaxID=2562311 RepID=UPI0010C0844B|nr:hypothetical protein [Roseomonas sp. AR75]